MRKSGIREPTEAASVNLALKETEMCIMCCIGLTKKKGACLLLFFFCFEKLWSLYNLLNRVDHQSSQELKFIGNLSL